MAKGVINDVGLHSLNRSGILCIFTLLQCLLMTAKLFSFLLVVGVWLFPETIHAQTTEDKPANPREFEYTKGDTTIIMKEYFMAIYLRVDNAPKISEKEAEKIQEGHLANISKYASSGQIQMAGPFGDDTEKRGILIFDVATQAEAEAILKEDPAVKAGRLTYEIHPWWAKKGTKLN